MNPCALSQGLVNEGELSSSSGCTSLGNRVLHGSNFGGDAVLTTGSLNDGSLSVHWLSNNNGRTISKMQRARFFNFGGAGIFNKRCSDSNFSHASWSFSLRSRNRYTLAPCSPACPFVRLPFWQKCCPNRGVCSRRRWLHSRPATPRTPRELH